MPIFDFHCTDCGADFEALVRNNSTAKCPKCGSEKLERLLSLPAVQTQGTHNLAMAAAKRRDAAQGKDRMHEQRKYELSHDD